MEKVTVSTVLITVVCIVVVTGLIKMVNWLWLKPKKLERLLRQQGFCGNSYRFLFGDLKDIRSLRTQALKTPMISFSNDYFARVEPLRHHLTTKYGSKDNFIWFGPVPMLSISNPELMREAMMNIYDFQKLKINPLLEKILPGLFSYEGEKWAKHRKIISPLFHVEKLKLMLPAFHDSCAEIISKWEKAVPETGSVELDVWPDMMKLTSDAISRAAFGSNYQEGQKLFELLKEQIDITLLMLQSLYFPGRRHIPTARNRRFKDIEHQIHASLSSMINKRMEATQAGESAKDDLLGILLDSNSKEIQQESGNNKNQQIGMGLQEVIDECKLFYLAGQETTSVLLVWTLILLSKHQDWQARAREEVLQTFGDKVPNYEDLSLLKTVTMVLYEVLRLYPPATQVSRSVHKDTNLGAFSIPSDIMITFFVYNAHRDQAIWGDDAQEFKPDRFAEGVSKATKGKNAFFPFGWGPRICLGEKFAMTEAKMALSMILQRFSLALSPSYIHAPMSVLFLQPQHGAQLTLHKL